MEDINSKIIDEYVNRLAQAQHDNIVLKIQLESVNKELSKLKPKKELKSVEESEEIEGD